MSEIAESVMSLAETHPDSVRVDDGFMIQGTLLSYGAVGAFQGLMDAGWELEDFKALAARIRRAGEIVVIGDTDEEIEETRLRLHSEKS